MRIKDKNQDFYDYIQHEYPDQSIVFDRSDSFTLTKQLVCEHLKYSRGYLKDSRFKFVLMQVCNTFWLFLVEITKYDNYIWGPENPTDYRVELLQTWKNYDKERKLLQIETVSLKWTIGHLMRDNNYRINEFDKGKILSNISVLTQAIDRNDYEVDSSMSNHTIRRDDDVYTEKHFPLLKASGFAALINPMDIYLSIEEFFSLNKQERERSESVGITDGEKIENHGFDKKTSFRGKR